MSGGLLCGVWGGPGSVEGSWAATGRSLGGPGGASERFWRSLRALGSILLESNGPNSLGIIVFLDNSRFSIMFQKNSVQSDCIRKCKESLTLVLICRNEIVDISL